MRSIQLDSFSNEPLIYIKFPETIEINYAVFGVMLCIIETEFGWCWKGLKNKRIRQAVTCVL